MIDALSKFVEEASCIKEHFPELEFIRQEDGEPLIEGALILSDKQDNFVDSYQIRINLSDDYPNRFPRVYEIGGRLPHNIDWHVFTDGHCCITSLPEEILACRQGITIPSFVERHLKPYFFNQSFREVNGYFLHERSHGALGNLEFFMDTFDTRNLRKINQFLIFISKRQEPNRVSTCFCGSGKKYRYCHRDAYRTMEHFCNEDLYQFIDYIKPHI